MKNKKKNLLNVRKDLKREETRLIRENQTKKEKERGKKRRDKSKREGERRTQRKRRERRIEVENLKF